MRALALVLLSAVVATAAPLHYDLAITVDEDGSIIGDATVRGVAAADWPQVVFRLYPAHFGDDQLSITGAWTEGRAVRWESLEPTTVTVELGATEGQTFSVTLAFAGKVPRFAESGGYGTYSASDHAVVLAQAYPILAPWDGGWIAYPVLPWGDAVVAEVADYTLDLTVPPGWTVVATGSEVEVDPGRYRVEGENLRELAVVLLRGYAYRDATAKGVEVRSFFLPEHEAPGQAALAITVDAIEALSARLDPHPFPRLDVVSVPLRHAAGVEYPGLILAGELYYNRFPLDPLFFPMIFAHEVAHQWWYAEVGSDQVAEPWVDEALATYTSGLYFEEEGRFADILRYWESSYAVGRVRNPRVGIASPLWAFPQGEGYGGIVYSGGALFFHALRDRMGDDAFFRALARYRDAFRWRIATADDLLRTLAEESLVSIDDLIAAWLER